MPQDGTASKRSKRANKAKRKVSRLGSFFGGLVGNAAKAKSGRRRQIDKALADAQR